MTKFDQWMTLAIAEAKLTANSADVPVAALVFDQNDNLVSVGRNERELTGDPTAHAEVVAIRAAAAATGSWRLDEMTLVVTLEPCTMCAGAILQARIPRVVFGAWDEKAGASGSVNDLLRDRRLPHKVEVVAGIQEAECAALLTDFFEARR
ncbi:MULTISPECIES: nucleoside deaminase [unclassified Salinibacterium]|uniref:nucleoside deaminase n=1 Tax=unclassified Salinibacterium TaxID=2632331 RepID=UPI0027DA6ADE|nr:MULTISPECIES: nucleoside deaminase [unclassified Salinibacterium]